MDFAQAIEFGKRSLSQPKEVPAPSSTESKLPTWPEAVRAMPNGIVRSALFAVIRKGDRHFVKKEKIASVGGVEIFFTGERFDQRDLDLWATVLHALRFQSMGAECRITAYALLQLQGLTDTGKNRVILQERLTRLRGNAVEIRQGESVYIGGLLNRAYTEEATKKWVIVLDPALLPLFASDQFTQIEWSIRQGLAGKQLAQWLYSFYASHAEPFPIKRSTLQRLCGSNAETTSKFNQTLKIALAAVRAACARYGQSFEYQVVGDLLHVSKTSTGTQRRHLAKKAKASQPNDLTSAPVLASRSVLALVESMTGTRKKRKKPNPGAAVGAELGPG